MMDERRQRLARSSQGAGSTLGFETESASVTTPLLQFYRAEAEQCEQLARQISLTSDRQYFLSCASELRAKAAALESESAQARSSSCA